MYVCICFAVTDHEIETEVRAGARTLREIAKRCGAGTGCGSCVHRIYALLCTYDTVPGVTYPALTA